MLRYPFYAVGLAFLLLGNLLRPLRKPTDYVVLFLEGAYPELRSPRAGFLQRRLFPDARLSLQELGDRFRAIQQDPRITGVVLHLRSLQMPASQVQTVREHIAQLRSAGKRVVTWSSSYDTIRYYLASAADEILLQAGGDAAPLGQRGTFIFLADALERAGVQADFIQISPYKSAADSLMRSSMSEEMREMSNWLVDAYYDDFIQAIASGRNMDLIAAKALVDGAPYTDLQAVEAGVVNRVISEEELPAYLGVAENSAPVGTLGGSTEAFAPSSSNRPRALRSLDSYRRGHF